MTVRFSSEAEFVEELRKDLSYVDRKIVRVTNVYHQSKMSPSILHVTVVAGYAAQGQLVKLEKYCGDRWGLGTGDEKTEATAKQVRDVVIQCCQDWGLEVRAGEFEHDAG